MIFRITTRTGIIDHDTVDISIDGSTVVSLMENVVDDTTPQLGGNLDMNGNQLTPNIGIGIASSSADGTLHVHTATAGTVTAHTDANDLIVENNGNGGISILGPDNVFQTLAFGSPTDNTGALIQWTHDVGDLQIGSARAGGELALYSGNMAEAARFDSGGNLGIGTGSPDGTLHVHTATAGAVTANTSANNLIVENSSNGGISILGPDSSVQQIYFGSPTLNSGSIIRWGHSDTLFHLGTAISGGETVIHSGSFVEAARFDSSGNFIVAIGDILLDDAKGIRDDSSNEQLIFQKTSSAVNYIEIENAATSNGPTVRATGSDTNVDLNLETKGTGALKINGDTWWQTASVQTAVGSAILLVSEVMAADSTHTVEAIGHGYQDLTGDTLHFHIFGGARNEGGTSTAVTEVVTKAADAGASTWNVAMDVNDSTDVWRILVTGQLAKVIDWTVRYRTIVTVGA